MRRFPLAALLTAILASAALAHQEKRPQPPIDCAGAPSDAMLQLPVPAAYWMGVICTDQGHTLAPISGDAWQIIQDDRALTIAASDDPAAAGGRHGSYFVSAELGELDTQSAAAARDLFAASADPSLLDSVRQTYALQLIDNRGGKDLIYVFLDDEGPVAGVACINACDKTVTVTVVHPEVESVEP